MPCCPGWEMVEGALRGVKSWVGGLGVSVKGSGSLPQHLGR